MELDAPRERSQSSVSASVGKGGEAIVSNLTQAHDPTPETAAKSPPALSDAQQTRMTSVGEPECGRLPFRRSRKDDGAIIRVIPFRCR